jgi:HD-GYP domain-containing protein (c-di-GMP phosphodiesterase class II)
MAHLIIWGDSRSMLATAAPPGSDEVRTLASLEVALDGRGAALVLADPVLLAAEREGFESWLRGGASARTIVVAVAQGGDGDELLQRFPFVDDVLAGPISPARLRLKLERAIETVHSRRVILQLERAFTRKDDDLKELNKIGMMLSAQRDIGKLLELILKKSREITGADAGSLYLVERAREADGADRLRFKLAQNDTMMLPFEESTMPLDTSSIAGYVAVTGQMRNVPDAYQLPRDSPFQISKVFDEVSGYRTKSMLVVPMRDHEDAVIGVVQLINKKRDFATVLRPVALVEEAVIPFTTTDVELASSLASQAAVAFENADLIDRVRNLFKSFVHAAVTAIEKRDPTTSGHSERVATLTVGLAQKVDGIGTGPLAGLRFNEDQIEELRYAALLHDFGKVAVQEKYLRKGKKLFTSQMIAIRQRFAFIRKAIEADYLRARLEALERGNEAPAALQAEYERRSAEVERVLQAVMAANEPTVVEEESFQALMSLPARTFPIAGSEEPGFENQEDFPVEDWASEPWLSARELEALSIRKGSLSNHERDKIQSHVTETYKFLQKIPWTSDLSRVAEIAWAHHEKLDGTGYPRALRGKEAIPVQSRMMTIADIYDALTAWDRPYKKHVPEERALGILCDEARDGKLDQDLLQVFLEAKIYRLPEFTERLQRRS